MNTVKRVQIISNRKKISIDTKNEIENIGRNFGYEIVDFDPDIVIAVGGDGTFISAVHKSKFNANARYLGINTGHFGFLQDINKSDIQNLFKYLNSEKVSISKINVLTIDICNRKNFHYSRKALNEIVVKNKQLKTLKCDLFLNYEHLETSRGDGFIVSTATGSTAYSMSSGGAIILGDLPVLQIIPCAPISNGAYNCIKNPIIFDKIVSIRPEGNILLTIDGRLSEIKDIKEITINIGQYTITRLNLGDMSSVKRLKNKFLK
ncbi:MAG: kinase [Clostridia bacterium]|jgi:NAD+ kinase|nr:kinase [Clostridia bacterium]